MVTPAATNGQLHRCRAAPTCDDDVDLSHSAAQQPGRGGGARLGAQARPGHRRRACRSSSRTTSTRRAIGTSTPPWRRCSNARRPSTTTRIAEELDAPGHVREAGRAAVPVGAEPVHAVGGAHRALRPHRARARRAAALHQRGAAGRRAGLEPAQGPGHGQAAGRGAGAGRLERHAEPARGAAAVRVDGAPDGLPGPGADGRSGRCLDRPARPGHDDARPVARAVPAGGRHGHGQDGASPARSRCTSPSTTARSCS